MPMLSSFPNIKAASWKRGLLRIWLLLSAIWVISYLYSQRTIIDLFNYVNASAHADNLWSGEIRAATSERMGEDILIAFLVPFGVLALLWIVSRIILWIWAGFRAGDSVE